MRSHELSQIKCDHELKSKNSLKIDDTINITQALFKLI
jgi:hypothetical protein